MSAGDPWQPLDKSSTERELLIRLDERIQALQREISGLGRLERRLGAIERQQALQRDKITAIDKRAGHQFEDGTADDLREMAKQWASNQESGVLMRRGVQSAIIGGCITIILFTIISPYLTKLLGIGG